MVRSDKAFVPAKPARDRRERGIERTRPDIVEAAARVFARGGFHAATVQAIAREAGFTAASLYTYFESKEAIFLALLEDMKRRVLATYDLDAPAGLSFAQRLELLLQRKLALVAERLDALRVLFDAPPPFRQGRDDRAAFLERAAGFLAEAGRRELRIPPAEAAHLLFGLMHGRILSRPLRQEEPDPRRLAGHVVDLFPHGAGKAS
jgi:AcrR family transcriptional regulator